ncbi:hypothetical protein WA158_001759 [Blastocystis sp. Blastoise]
MSEDQSDILLTGTTLLESSIEGSVRIEEDIRHFLVNDISHLNQMSSYSFISNSYINSLLSNPSCQIIYNSLPYSTLLSSFLINLIDISPDDFISLYIYIIIILLLNHWCPPNNIHQGLLSLHQITRQIKPCPISKDYLYMAFLFIELDSRDYVVDIKDILSSISSLPFCIYTTLASKAYQNKDTVVFPLICLYGSPLSLISLQIPYVSLTKVSSHWMNPSLFEIPLQSSNKRKAIDINLTDNCTEINPETLVNHSYMKAYLFLCQLPYSIYKYSLFCIYMDELYKENKQQQIIELEFNDEFMNYIYKYLSQTHRWKTFMPYLLNRPISNYRSFIHSLHEDHIYDYDNQLLENRTIFFPTSTVTMNSEIPSTPYIPKKKH